MTVAPSTEISSVRDWSTLLPELLVSVAERLLTADIIRLSAVCRRWAWILGRICRGYCSWPPPYRASLVPLSGTVVPWLLLPNNKGEEADCCSFLPLKPHRRDSIYLFPLPEMVGRRFVGSSPDGWMVTLDLALQPRILNPLTHEEIPLPSLLNVGLDFTPVFDSDGSVLKFVKHYRRLFRVQDFRDQYVQKIVLTSAPPAGGIAVGIYGFSASGTFIALARPGDNRWATIPKPPNHEDFQDAVYRREDQCLYAITSDAGVLIFHLSDLISVVPIQVIKAETLTKRMNPMIMVDPASAMHLVFLGCDLLQIWRIYELDDRSDFDDDEDEYYGHGRVETIDVKVMKYQSQKSQAFDVIDDAGTEWVPIRDLGDYSVFVGCNHAFAVHVDANDNDSIFGLRRNCIYFTDENSQFRSFTNRKWLVPDVGVYDLEKDTIVHKFFSSDSNRFCNWPPSVWFFPTRLSFTPPHL